MVFKTFETPILNENMKTGPLSYLDLRKMGSRTPPHIDLGLLYMLDSLSVNLTQGVAKRWQTALPQNGLDRVFRGRLAPSLS